MMKNASLRQLKVFESVARNLSYTRAAEELYLTQPTVSIQIKQLSEIVGQPLFEQVGKRIYLTDAGSELLKVCREILEGLSRFEMYISDIKGVKTGKLRLAVITTAKYIIPRILGQFCQRFPGIDVSLKVTNRERVLQRMHENLDDIYIFGNPPDNIDVHTEIFMENPLIVLASSKHILSKEKNIVPERLADEYFIIREPGSGIRLSTDQFFAEHNVKIKVRMELGSNEAIKQAVAAELGIAVLSAHTMVSDWNSEELAYLDVRGFPIRRQWYLTYPRDKQQSVVALAFMDFMHKEGSAIGKKYLQGIPSFPISR